MLLPVSEDPVTYVCLKAPHLVYSSWLYLQDKLQSQGYWKLYKNGRSFFNPVRYRCAQYAEVTLKSNLEANAIVQGTWAQRVEWIALMCTLELRKKKLLISSLIHSMHSSLFKYKGHCTRRSTYLNLGAKNKMAIENFTATVGNMGAQKHKWQSCTATNIEITTSQLARKLPAQMWSLRGQYLFHMGHHLWPPIDSDPQVSTSLLKEENIFLQTEGGMKIKKVWIHLWD